MIKAQSFFDRPAPTARSQTRRGFLAAAAGLLTAATGRPNSSRARVYAAAENSIRWLVFYGRTAEESILATYDIVVLDPGFQGSISRLADAGTPVCGYLSLGEIRTSDPFLTFVDPAALLPENPDWPGTRRVDIRNPSWHLLMLDRRIPSLVSQGFTGLMFDTLDTPPHLESVDPVRYGGMREAAVALVHSIRLRWPEMALIMNRGYALLPDVVEDVDAIIAESLMTSPGCGGRGFAWADLHEVEEQLMLLDPAARRHPVLPILSLDYWDPEDTNTIAEIYRRERELGHHPYVATRSLDIIVPEAR
jgi:polysaccharide biosynthesis protein PelA